MAFITKENLSGSEADKELIRKISLRKNELSWFKKKKEKES